MMVTLEPCPHCGTPLTPSLVAEIKNPNGEASCPSRPRPRKTSMQVLGEAMLEVARSIPSVLLAVAPGLVGAQESEARIGVMFEMVHLDRSVFEPELTQLARTTGLSREQAAERIIRREVRASAITGPGSLTGLALS